MSYNAGVVYKDLQDIPDDEQRRDYEDHRPTTSHILAAEETKVKGAAQQPHDDQVLDLGWSENGHHLSESLIGGVDNEDVWLLIRRFNKQVQHIKETSKPPVGGLDLQISDNEEYSAIKLRSQIERMYMGVMVGILSASKHLARLRSWREPKRTAAFCAVYFVAWALHSLAPVITAVLIVLVVSPAARTLLLPPAPMALVSHTDGGPTQPQAGVLGSTDTTTGAPENQKGEALENEASNFVTGLGAIAMNAMTESDEVESGGQEGAGDTYPAPNQIATMVATAKDKASAVEKPSQDKTKVPMETFMWAQMKPLMHILELVSDTWERFGNALSPTPPFPKDQARFRFAFLLSPVLVASHFLSADAVGRACALGFGVLFFGDPAIQQVLKRLEKHDPNWQNTYSLSNTLLHGVPNSAQLALTLLRLGEAHNAPLPPPPVISSAPHPRPIDISHDQVLSSGTTDQPLGATDAELNDAARLRPDRFERAGGADVEMTKAMGGSNPRRGTSKLLSLVKDGASGFMKAAVGIDRLRAKAGSSERAKLRVGALPIKGDVKSGEIGPSEWICRNDGKKGVLRLDSQSGSDLVAKKMAFVAKDKLEEEGTVLWELAIDSISQLKKHQGFGFKYKLMVGWTTEQTIRDGLEIFDKTGREYIVTAVPRRDDLFNRLCSMGGQKWEIS